MRGTDEVDHRLQGPIKRDQQTSHLSCNCVGHAAGSLVDLVTYSSQLNAERMYGNKAPLQKQ